MTKTTIKETTEKYDQNGKLVERIIREEITEDDNDYTQFSSISPWATPNYCQTGTITAENITLSNEVTNHDIR